VRPLPPENSNFTLGKHVPPRPWKSCGHFIALEQLSRLRLFDEVLKLFMEGQALRVYWPAEALNLFRPLFARPNRQYWMRRPPAPAHLIEQGLVNTDAPHQARTSLRPPRRFYFAVMLWPVVRREMAQLQPRVLVIHPSDSQRCISGGAQKLAVCSRPRRSQPHLLHLARRFTNRPCASFLAELSERCDSAAAPDARGLRELRWNMPLLSCSPQANDVSGCCVEQPD